MSRAGCPAAKTTKGGGATIKPKMKIDVRTRGGAYLVAEGVATNDKDITRIVNRTKGYRRMVGIEEYVLRDGKAIVQDTEGHWVDA